MNQPCWVTQIHPLIASFVEQRNVADMSKAYFLPGGIGMSKVNYSSNKV